jgi:putative transposase
MLGWRVPLREAIPYGQAPKYLIRDNDSKFGSSFARVAATSGIKILKTPYHAPRANAICVRFMRSVRQECLDHLLIFQEKQLQRVLNAYVGYAQPITIASRNCAADP